MLLRQHSEILCQEIRKKKEERDRGREGGRKEEKIVYDFLFLLFCFYSARD
jgi:hypothetical protein